MNDPQQEFAFLRLHEGGIALGRGPFVARACPRNGETAFYQNDFGLTDPRPWKVPASLELVEDPCARLDPRLLGEAVDLRWENLGWSDFGTVFAEIQEAFSTEEDLQKVVPVVTERALLLRGSPLHWIERLFEGLSPKLWPYGYSWGDRGVIGATPECLLHVNGRWIETMALAGTARPGQDHAFESDSKQIREHEFVVRHLAEVLADLGELRQEARRILHLEGIVHFLTRMSLQADAAPDLNALIRRIHPTPAVGVFPRLPGNLRRLDQWRQRLQTPAVFGAPFGLWHNDVFHSLVAIRHLSWEGRQLFLPSGCGVIAASKMEQEWQELSLKRSVVKEMIGVTEGSSWMTLRTNGEQMKPTCL